MKKLFKNKKNTKRKGFTLIELLAVIVILAIVLVVTIPSVISSMKSAKEKQLQNSVDVVADWLNKQAAAAKLGDEFVSQEYKDFISSSSCSCSDPSNCQCSDEECIIKEYALDNDTAKAMLNAAGVSNLEDLNLFNSEVIMDTANDYAGVYFKAADKGSFSVSDNQTNEAISTGATEHGIEKPALFDLIKRTTVTESKLEQKDNRTLSPNIYYTSVAGSGYFRTGMIKDVAVGKNSISFNYANKTANYGVLVPFILDSNYKYKINYEKSDNGAVHITYYDDDGKYLTYFPIASGASFAPNPSGKITGITFVAITAESAWFNNISIEKVPK